MIDGEGHIIIYKQNRHKMAKYKGNHKSPVYTLIVGCTNTERSLIEFLYKRWGACRQFRPRQRKNWKPVYDWTIQADMAMNFLKEIYPFFTSKKWKAKLAIKFQEGKFLRKNKKGRSRKIPKAELERRDRIWKKLNLHRH